jgi:hypothetical protein
MTALPSPETLFAELAPEVLAAVPPADTGRASTALRALTADWLREAAATDAATGHRVLQILTTDMERQLAARPPAEKTAWIEAVLLQRQVDAVAARTFALGREILDKAVGDDEARARGAALLAEVEALAPRVRAVTDPTLRAPLDQALQDALMEALFAVERKGMSLRLSRVAPAR